MESLELVRGGDEGCQFVNFRIWCIKWKSRIYVQVDQGFDFYFLDNLVRNNLGVSDFYLLKVD